MSILYENNYWMRSPLQKTIWNLMIIKFNSYFGLIVLQMLPLLMFLILYEILHTKIIFNISRILSNRHILVRNLCIIITPIGHGNEFEYLLDNSFNAHIRLADLSSSFVEFRSDSDWLRGINRKTNVLNGPLKHHLKLMSLY